MDFCYSVFDSVSDNQPKPRTDCFTAFRSRFDRFQLLQRKEKGKLFSPARFTPGTTRKSENVVDVCAMVLDFDNGVDPSDFIDDWKEKQLAFWWHTTFNHTPEKPKWRAIFPLATPIPAYQWARAWEAASEYLGHGQCDISAKNADRIYYMPSRPVEGDKHLFHSEANEGYLLDPSFLLRSDEKPPEGKGRVGDDFELRATISEILEPHGWIFSRKSGQLEYWARPGKQKGEISATWGWRSEVQGERFYCFSDNAGIPCRNYLTKFALYTMLNHGGDWKASTVSLSKQGYGIQVVAGGTPSPSSSPVSSPPAAVMSMGRLEREVLGYWLERSLGKQSHTNGRGLGPGLATAKRTCR